MKQKVIVALCAVALIVGTVTAVRVSDQFQANAINKAKAQQTAQHDAEIAEMKKTADDAETIKRLRTACQTGQKSYDAMQRQFTPLQKANATKEGVLRPVCQ